MAGRASGLLKTEWWDAGMVMCLGQGAGLLMFQLVPLPPCHLADNNWRTLCFDVNFLQLLQSPEIEIA